MAGRERVQVSYTKWMLSQLNQWSGVDGGKGASTSKRRKAAIPARCDVIIVHMKV